MFRQHFDQREETAPPCGSKRHLHLFPTAVLRGRNLYWFLQMISGLTAGIKHQSIFLFFSELHHHLHLHHHMTQTQQHPHVKALKDYSTTSKINLYQMFGQRFLKRHKLTPKHVTWQLQVEIRRFSTDLQRTINLKHTQGRPFQPITGLEVRGPSSEEEEDSLASPHQQAAEKEKRRDPDVSSCSHSSRHGDQPQHSVLVMNTSLQFSKL